MKRWLIFILCIAAFLQGHDVYSQKYLDVGYGKQIFRSHNGEGYLPLLKGLEHNGAFVAFRYEMFVRDTVTCPVSVQIGLKYDLQYARDEKPKANHLEQYISLPVLFNFYIRNKASKPVMSFFAGPVLSLDVYSKYRIKGDRKTSPVTYNILDGYGYTNLDLLACVGCSFNLSKKYDLRMAYNVGLCNRRDLVDGPFVTEKSKYMRLNSDMLNIGIAYKF